MIKILSFLQIFLLIYLFLIKNCHLNLLLDIFLLEKYNCQNNILKETRTNKDDFIIKVYLYIQYNIYII